MVQDAQGYCIVRYVSIADIERKSIRLTVAFMCSLEIKLTEARLLTLTLAAVAVAVLVIRERRFFNLSRGFTV